MCGRILADLGADVIRVEPPGGSECRRREPIVDGESLSFAYRNANKRGVTLDTSRRTGLALFERLLSIADVWVETSSPASSEEPDPDRLAAEHAHLVVVSITPFGRTGPYRDFVATDMVAFAMGGMMYRSGAREKPPLVAPGAFAYDAAGVTAAFAGLMACFHRLRTGRGEHVDVSIMDAVANLADWALPASSLSGTAAHRQGAGLIYPIFRCADGHVCMVVPLSPRQWVALREWLGEPAELMDEAWSQVAYRLSHLRTLNPYITDLLGDEKMVDVAREAQRRGLAVTPVLRPAEVIDNEHVASRGTFVEAEVVAGRTAAVPSGFFQLDGARAGFRTRAPAAGEQNDDVYRDLLGMPAEQVASLRAEGVI